MQNAKMQNAKCEMPFRVCILHSAFSIQHSYRIGTHISVFSFCLSGSFIGLFK